MATTRAAIKTLKPGKYCMIDGEPYMVKSVVSSKAGKHGGAKTRLDANNIYTGKFKTIVKPADTEIEVPIIEKKTGQVVAITGEAAQIMDLETYETFESAIPEELKGKLTNGSEVMYWIIEGRKILVQVR